MLGMAWEFLFVVNVVGDPEREREERERESGGVSAREYARSCDLET